MHHAKPYTFKALAVIGGIALAYGFVTHVISKPIQYVALCDKDAKLDTCQVVQAEFSYDGMDNQFVIYKLYTSPDKPETFTRTNCWVKPEGSECMDSSTNENNTSIKKVIIPLALQLRDWRWSTPKQYSK